MHRCIYFVFVLSIIYLRLSSANADVGDDEDDGINNDDFYADRITSINSTAETTTTTTLEPIVEEIVENITEVSLVTTTTTIHEEITKSFVTQYLLNANRSLAPSDLTFTSYFNDSLLVAIEEHELYLISKTDGSLRKDFKYGNVISIKPSNYLIIYDDNTQDLWIIDATDEKISKISFKPKQIFVSPSDNTIWIAETNDQLYISENSGSIWKKIDESSGSIVLGWSNKPNSLVILQHSNYLKVLDLTSHKLTTISTDIQSAKLFSRYLLIKRLNVDNSISITHVNNLAENSFRSLPKRFQSQGNFYCAVEDIYTQDLLFLFMTEDRVGDNNETVLSTCQLISYSKQNSFFLPEIDCARIRNDNSANTLECTKDQIPFYQVRGLSKSVYLANTETGPTTVVSLDDGATWNKTQYECDKAIHCPRNALIVISSLISSNDAPGILLGKATDGTNDYIAISTNGGRQWRLNFKNNSYSTVISNPNALLMAVPNVNQQSLEHSFRYSTDYGRHWHDEIFLNETAFQILSVIADRNNQFYLLTFNDQNQLGLIQLDLNLVISHRCDRSQLKEWSLHNACNNGSKFYYQRRVPGSHCLEENVQIRSEPCVCSLTDFECLPGYKRSSDGICLPKSQYISSQDCTCSENNATRSTKRGYVKSDSSQCINGVESYLSNAFVTRRDPNQPNFLIYGVNSRTQRPTIEIHSNDFNQDTDDDNDEEDEDDNSSENLVWSVDPSYDITAMTFDETGQQFYIAVDREQFAIVYKINKNLRQQNHYAKQILFDANNELLKTTDGRIEYLTIDWSAQNLYILLRNRSNRQQSIVLFDLRTRKRRTIVKNQQIQPSILLIDPLKTDLYWITHNSPSILNIGNLQGELKNKIPLSTSDLNVNYFSYDPISHEIIYVIDSNIYGMNTLNSRHPSPRIIYDHSSKIDNALFVYPILYFTSQNNQTQSSNIQLHAIDILAKSFAKNIAKFKDLNALKLFVDMAPTMPTGTIINRCATNPCSDICIPLEHERFRCVCSDDARYQSCSCPTDERFVLGSCQAKNGQCAPGRVLCQNRLNCAESARICEQDHTQYTDEFKTTSRCTLDQPNDGFDCYYPIHGTNNTCVPFQWLCDGVYDCPLGNDEAHCHKLTTTTKPTSKANQCLTSNKYTHIMCGNQCMRIETVCQNISNIARCSDAFHLHCKQTNDRDQYDCKCFDANDRCIAMNEQCDDYDNCDRICQESIREANSITNRILQTSSLPWIILAVAILVILIIAIIVITVRYRRRTKNLTNTATASRTPAAAETVDVPSNETRERLLNNGTNVANETN